MRRTRHADGTVHFSDLKHFARSPAHYLEAVNGTFESSPAMRVGTAAHAELLGAQEGKRILTFSGRRSGDAWREAKEANPDAEFVSIAELDQGRRIADAVRADPVAKDLLEGGILTEVPMRWTDAGIARSTRGVDIVGPGLLAEFKTTTNTHPEHLQRHAVRSLWHAQLADYRRGAEQVLELVAPRVVVIACEVRPPYAVTVLEVAEEVLALGERAINAWSEDFRRCEENNDWPTYQKAPVKWTLPDWLNSDLELDDEEHFAA